MMTDEGLLFRGGAALSVLGGSFAKIVEVGDDEQLVFHFLKLMVRSPSPF